ncbi:hypothetical protein PR001_g15772 [Phytophthora rubi]|uniref:HTH CENPB-type domain-containing protein n=1 Tax=Phytophthora rubi TaxID=129364 RepID=A0A6A3L1Q8_9STRA|nr:hypothetical protein PR001_g15772 [Phytophthora rubi]
MNRVYLTVSEKNKLRQHARAHPLLKTEQLREWTQEHFGKLPALTTVAAIVRAPISGSVLNPDAKRVQKGKFPDMEAELFQAIERRAEEQGVRVQALQNDPVLSDVSLWQMANSILERTNGGTVKPSWVTKFKKRHGLLPDQLARAARQARTTSPTTNFASCAVSNSHIRVADEEEMKDEHAGQEDTAPPQLYPQYLHIARAVKKVSLADMARYALLHRVGGLYVDADFECLQPFDALHRDNELFLSSEPLVHSVLLEKSNSAALCNALMASAPGHPFWLQVLDNIKAKFDHERLKSDAVELTGPRMLKQTYEALNSTFNADIVVFPSEFFYPEVAYWNMEPMQEACRRRHDEEAREACEWLNKFPKGEFTRNTHATHHWQCTWCRDAQLDEFGHLRDVFESPVMRPNITATGIDFIALG